MASVAQQQDNTPDLRAQIEQLQRQLAATCISSHKVERKLSPFNAETGLTYQLWRKDCQMAIQFNEWPVKTLIAKVYETCSGRAKEKLLQVDATASSVDDFMAILDTLFAPRNRLAMFTTLNSLKQRDSESIYDFRIRVEAAFIDLYGSIKGHEIDAIQKFALGLRQVKVASHIATTLRYDSLDKAADKAEEVARVLAFEHAHATKQQAASDDAYAVCSMQATTTKRNQSQPTALACYFCGRSGHFK